MRTKVVVTVNPEFVVEASRNAEFYHILSQAKYVIPDGRGIQLAGEYLFICQTTADWSMFFRIFGNLVIGLGLGLWDLVGGLKYRVFPYRLTGVELMVKLVKKAEKQGKTMMLVGGGSSELVKQTAKKLRRVWPNLSVVCDRGHKRVGKIDKQYKKDEARILEKIEKSQPSYLMVAYGAPRQEKWLFGHTERLTAMGVEVSMGVGGAFEYIVRAKTEDGQIDLGIARHEWLRRLRREPGKRLMRIYRAVVVFPFLVYRESLSQSENSLTKSHRLTKLIIRWSKYDTTQFV